jgi:uncharacterized protein (TIGR02453 family)
MTSGKFRGWPPDAFAFYEGLEADNSRTYWQANKPVYDESVKEPFLALSDAIAREFGELRVFRPNRDTRFAKDKSPYKTNAAAVSESEGGSRYYVSLSSDGLFVGTGYYALASDQLERWRQSVADNKTGPAIAKIVADAHKKKYETGAHDSLKTAPRGYDKEHPRVELLRQKGLYMGKQYPLAKWMHGAGALEKIVVVWRDAKPMNRWLDKHVGPSTLPPDDSRW